MIYRELGKTGLRVSVIGMGCEGFSEDGYAMTARLLDRAQTLGINYFDLYSPDPLLRRAVGTALRGRRDAFYIQGHLCAVWRGGQYTRTRDLSETRQGFEDMMAQLQTDHLDVGMIHYCDAMADWETIVETGILDYARELKAAGRIRHIGLSSHNPLVAERAVQEGGVEVLMFSVNPCYDLQPAGEDVEALWDPKNYEAELTNMDPDRQRLYETCQRLGVGITVMKAFGGGDLLDAGLSPAGAALTAAQCISYALSRPVAATVLAGAHSVAQLEKSAAYCETDEAERDYAAALAAFPRIRWQGHCMYCSHCAPCPRRISVADVTKFLNLALAQGRLPETVREHYASLEHHAGECIGCGLCQTRCPFGVNIIENMRRAAELFGC